MLCSWCRHAQPEAKLRAKCEEFQQRMVSCIAFCEHSQCVYSLQMALHGHAAHQCRECDHRQHDSISFLNVAFMKQDFACTRSNKTHYLVTMSAAKETYAASILTVLFMRIVLQVDDSDMRNMTTSGAI